MKAYYTEKPQWQSTHKEHVIELAKDWCFVVDGTDFWIHSGYRCDGASIPAIFWAVPGIGTPTSGFNAIGAWAHDALYLTHALTRSQADEVAFQLWRQAGKPLWSARTMWAAVRSPAGAWAYRNTGADMEELAINRQILKLRDNIDRFRSLWFVDKPMPLDS